MKKIIKLGMAALTALTMAGCSSESEDVKTITVGILLLMNPKIKRETLLDSIQI